MYKDNVNFKRLLGGLTLKTALTVAWVDPVCWDEVPFCEELCRPAAILAYHKAEVSEMWDRETYNSLKDVLQQVNNNSISNHLYTVRMILWCDDRGLTCCTAARLWSWAVLRLCCCWRAAVCNIRCCCWAAYICCRYCAAVLGCLCNACWNTWK